MLDELVAIDETVVTIQRECTKEEKIAVNRYVTDTIMANITDDDELILNSN